MYEINRVRRNVCNDSSFKTYIVCLRVYAELTNINIYVPDVKN